MPYTHLPDPEMQPEFYADIPVKRLIAFVVDTALILLLCVLIVPFTAFTGLFFFPLLMLVVGFAYRVVTLANWSATPGMLLMAIEFRTHEGARFDAQMAALHTLGLSISLAMPIVQVASIVMMLTGARAQGLSDHMLGTAAVNRPAGR